MKNDPISHLQLTLTRSDAGGHLAVPLDTFLEFDLGITHDLEQLVGRWSDMSTPRSGRALPSARRRRIRRPK